jgi:sec-independent protein translocase protein TatC
MGANLPSRIPGVDHDIYDPFWAIPMCLLYEIGILAARLVSKPVADEMSSSQGGFVQAAAVDGGNSAEMDAEMDKADAEFKKLTGK